MRIVRILGMAPNLSEMPPTPPDIEVWCSNEKRGFTKRLPRILETSEWTHWFNLHSRQHWQERYPATLDWYKAQDGSKPLYTQKFWADLPGCVKFPRQQIQETFAINGKPNRYFTCSIAWLLAFAIFGKVDRMELWGFALSDTKPGERYVFERPCFFYWVQQARNRGIDVWYQPAIEVIPFEPGDPTTYTGTLYGYSTKPELDWDPVLETFIGEQ